ncbi:MAG TPA: type VII secretion-associated serine protease mycosin [Natronosporangium sp.]
MIARPHAARPRRAASWALAAVVAAGLVAPAPAAAAEPVSRLTSTQVNYQAHAQLDPLGAEQAWQHSTGAGVLVAVLDSGVDADHPDLAGRVIAGHDFVDGSTDGRVDPVGHGTTVASQIVGGGDPAIGLAPDATILPVRVLDEQNRYRNAATVADGVRWAVDHGAQVINLSLGGTQDSAALADALAYAMDHDVVVVACTGNLTGDGNTRVWYPAREPGVVAVAGITYVDGEPARWPSSLTGSATVLTAPAVVTGAQAGGGYRDVQGTSFAAALVTGVAALIRSRYPELSAGDVVNRLVVTAQDAGEPGRDPVYGFGTVDPVAALTAPVAEVPSNPLDTKARYGANGFGAAPGLPVEPADGTELDHGQGYLLPWPANGGEPAPDRGSAVPASAEVAGGQADLARRADRSGPPWPLLVLLTALPVAVAGLGWRRARG